MALVLANLPGEAEVPHQGAAGNTRGELAKVWKLFESTNGSWLLKCDPQSVKEQRLI